MEMLKLGVQKKLYKGLFPCQAINLESRINLLVHQYVSSYLIHEYQLWPQRAYLGVLRLLSYLVQV